MTQHGAVAGDGVHGTQQSHISCVLPHNTKKVEKSAEGNAFFDRILFLGKCLRGCFEPCQQHTFREYINR